MALINKIRKRAGLAVGIVAVAMGLFVVGTDLFTSNSALLGNNNTEIGEIAGEEIDYKEFQRELEELTYNFALRTNRNPSENELYTLRQQAWEMLIVKTAFQQQYDELGLKVTGEEHWDMLQGNNVNPNIRQYFTNPETGEFDRNAIIQHLKTLRNIPDNQPQKLFWKLLEESLDPARLRLKYDYLLVNTTYVTEAEARRQYEAETSVAEVEYLYVPYYSVPDSAISYSDSDLQNYYNEHKDDFKVEESRSVSYVKFDVIPSSTDTLYFKEEMARIADEFKEVEEDSLFAKSRSDSRNFFGRYSIDQLPSQLQNNFSNLSEGDVRGPYYVNGFLALYKISEISEDTVEAARARHILIKWDNESDAAKAEARQEAESILRQLRNGADFDDLARERSEDPGSAAKGGDLGWFGKGRMVKPFEEAVFGASREGLIRRPIESQFGYHIIDVTQTPDNTMLKVATIEREISPSSETINDAYLQAEILASGSDSYKAFVENAREDSIEVFTAENIDKNDRRLNNIGNARSVVQWMYKDASVGDVSKVFELEDSYVVAVLTGIIEEGVAPFSEVKDQVITKVKNQKAAQIISEKLKGLTGSLRERAEAYGPAAVVHTSSDLNLSSNTLTGVGFVPKVVGTIFGMQTGETSGLLEAENGIVIVKLEALTPAPEIADYASYKNQIEQSVSGRTSYGISEAIREAADIEDYRYRFF